MSREILCYDCHNALSERMSFQFIDGDQANGEVVLTTVCPHCGAENMVVIDGMNMQIETTDPDEVCERVIMPIGGGPYVVESESKKHKFRKSKKIWGRH